MLNYDQLKEELKELRQEIIDKKRLKDDEREDLKAAIIMLFIFINHQIEDAKNGD